MKLFPVKKSYIWAFLIALMVIGWMVSDDLFDTSGSRDLAQDTGNTISTTDLGKIQPITVNAVKVKNEETALTVRATGVTNTIFDIKIIARRSGVVKSIKVEEGNWIDERQTILELDSGTLETDLQAAQADRLAALAVYNDTKRRYGNSGEIAVKLRAAEADLESNKKTYEIAKSLVKQGVQSELALSQKRALLRAAETRLFELQNLPKELELSTSYARLKLIDSRILQLKEQLGFTKILSPQRGWLNNLNVELGEFVNENRVLADILGLQTLTLTIPIAQINIRKISIDDLVKINFAGLGTVYGHVEKIGAKANQATRTFNVEINLENSDGKLRAGMTAEAEVIIGEVKAFKISPAHLNVLDDGRLSVKLVNELDRVEVIGVKLVRTAGNYAFISGIPDGAILLTSGQAYLNEGELVNYSLNEENET